MEHNASAHALGPCYQRPVLKIELGTQFSRCSESAHRLYRWTWAELKRSRASKSVRGRGCSGDVGQGLRLHAATPRPAFDWPETRAFALHAVDGLRKCGAFPLHVQRYVLLVTTLCGPICAADSTI
ncbi:unnamed protein product, partial [Iphiclides podalirius]